MVEIKKLYIEHSKSEKSKNEYDVLKCEYATEDGELIVQNITFDNAVLLVLADLSPSIFAKKLKNVGDTIVLLGN